jgi:hypothetical protein
VAANLVVEIAAIARPVRGIGTIVVRLAGEACAAPVLAHHTNARTNISALLVPAALHALVAFVLGHAFEVFVHATNLSIVAVLVFQAFHLAAAASVIALHSWIAVFAGGAFSPLERAIPVDGRIVAVAVGGGHAQQEKQQGQYRKSSCSHHQSSFRG